MDVANSCITGDQPGNGMLESLSDFEMDMFANLDTRRSVCEWRRTVGGGTWCLNLWTEIRRYLTTLRFSFAFLVSGKWPMSIIIFLVYNINQRLLTSDKKHNSKLLLLKHALLNLIPDFKITTRKN
jgi:hypothetical protein